MGFKTLIKQFRGIFTMPQNEYLSQEKINHGIDFGVSVNNDNALKITALYSGIRIRSENIASFPKYIKKKTLNGLENATDHPAYKVIAIRPNGYTNVFDFWFTINAWLDGWGNAYAIIKRDGAGNPIELHQVHPADINLTIVQGKKYVKVNMSNRNLSFLNGVYSSDDILHFMLVTFDGIEGVNPIIYNAIALGKALATQKFGAEYYKKGGEIKAVLESDGSLGDKEYNNFITHYKQASQNFETPLLEYGIKYKQIGISPVAAQLVQSETISIQDICRILNIPPHMIAELSRSTFSNIEHQNIQFVQYSLRPTVKRLEVEIENKLFLDTEQGEYSVKFDLSGLLRGDTASRSAFYHNAILDGYYNRNEVRELEGLPREEGLNEFLYPLNTGIVGKNIENGKQNNTGKDS